ncbi:predicted protein [Chaetomium globosum CBS 148.51]|uniref:Uncharacterized protein n=1 Tax=Chaetomium globosum (strain ATCC 6205 / CBS 148.51 / DSM 1962 / NBRC 6347 / NRRL 1970) TaxID=306901 RepID=Q2HG21_CHAGB|nr:uncharacterized protein CHGG_00833 [Chaetomium globosum CBS 148.51]EAQ92598.1 predicted protein [Chaetomium globosum CBS 148.51]
MAAGPGTAERKSAHIRSWPAIAGMAKSPKHAALPFVGPSYPIQEKFRPVAVCNPRAVVANPKRPRLPIRPPLIMHTHGQRVPATLDWTLHLFMWTLAARPVWHQPRLGCDLL